MTSQDNSNSKIRQPLWGILGGMGPLASAEFLSTIYRASLYYKLKLGPQAMEQEQDMPRVVLVSDPTIPDRTKAINEQHSNAKQYQQVINALTRKLDELLNLGVDDMAIACVTAHHFLDKLPESLGSRITSLLDIAYEKLDSVSG